MQESPSIVGEVFFIMICTMAGDVTGRWWNEPLPTWRRPTDVLSTRV
ncbi:MAG: hypothetical protein JSS48_01545 [Nitrospira sp.]|nr:hypothetical protein [Nitrospira sp.]MBX3337894.1 hypothetical protein [Nitrospira sp.]MCW5781430.1 hypothetical protein [Nitrospira sp.]HMZ55195.1 hypothetical protein [Nitrospira sp.]HNK14517.1 hypothetical protein [Nitrospira sp.]